MGKIKQLFLTNQFFYSLLGIATFFAISFFMKGLFTVAWIVFWLWLAVLIFDFIVLFSGKGRVEITRIYPEKLSNGDENPMKLMINSFYPFPTSIEILEEFPIQLQIRNNEYFTRLSAYQSTEISYLMRPTQRGIYEFGRCIALVKRFGFFKRRFLTNQAQQIPCYPSYIQLRKYQLLATSNRLNELGIKRIRRIGSAMEFDHVREYVQGDDYRHMNWKATAKIKKLMVNQYEEEKSQPIYSFIDLGRAMRMPFDGLTLLDYAINASLVLSNATILKQDRAGLLTFSKEVNVFIPAEKRNNQMLKISEALYQVTTNFEEPEYGKLYSYAKAHINKRSLIFLYTNFETLDSLRRQMNYLSMLNRSHIIVVIVFKNVEVEDLAKSAPKKTIEIYNQIIAEKFIYEKQLIVQELIRNGFQTIYTAPENLTINSINKYLEIKARGLI
ncbi:MULTISPECIES: DUF58 domain-containing protein [Sphingobacterium]|uniref:DUF58 domain-containing protein n=1 Tax=Sphingobacterium athyrii TaxID=2152717 RepID=A0A363NR66_9SPHI|nr:MULTISPECIES: DUF58 domain-containing protein [Sphingobacterium]PUV23227.1 DUF58 domain-containing protein [Sphingobacterium athyrii]QIH36812.1 DUF58 domain-containing protein [Sphingobacterium sp. DR205]